LGICVEFFFGTFAAPKPPPSPLTIFIWDFGGSQQKNFSSILQNLADFGGWKAEPGLFFFPKFWIKQFLNSKWYFMLGVFSLKGSLRSCNCVSYEINGWDSSDWLKRKKTSLNGEYFYVVQNCSRKQETTLRIMRRFSQIWSVHVPVSITIIYLMISYPKNSFFPSWRS